MQRAWLPGAILVVAFAARPARADEPAAPPESADEVRVTGERAALKRSTKDETPSSTVLDEATLRGAGASLGDALRPVAGVVLSSAGSASDLTTISIRGATSGQLPVYLGGVRLNDDLTGSFDASTVPTWMLRRVELFRGNAPPSGDRLGLAGALFLEPLRAQGPLARVSTTVGSFGSRELAGLVAVGDRETSALVAVRHATAANDYPYTQDNGTLGTTTDDARARRANADATTTDAWSTGRAKVGRVVIKSLVHAFYREQGAPGQLLVPALRARLTTTRGLADVTAEGSCGDGCRLDAGLSALRSSTNVRDPEREIGLGTTSVHTIGTRLSPHGRLALDLPHRLSLGVGLDLAREALDRQAGQAAVGDDGIPGRTDATKARRLAAHGSAQLVWEATRRMRASWLGAVDVTDTAATGSTSDTSNTRAPLSSRLGARIGDDELAVLANLGRAVRLPTLGELYGQSAVLGGNAALLPERAWGLDLGLRGKLAPTGTRVLFEAQTFVFGRKTDDLVVYQRDSFLVFRPRNVRASRTLGAEGSFAVSAFRLVRAEQGVTLLDARDTSGGPGIFEGQLPFLPRLVSSTRLTVTPWAPNQRTEAAASATLVRQGARFADRSGLVVIPAQTTLDLEARLRWPCGAHVEATLRARADNVTSARRVDVIGYPLPPRQLFLSLELAAGGGS